MNLFKRLSKGMSNIYIKVTKLVFSKLRFSKVKVRLQVSFWGAPAHADIIVILKGIMTF